MSSAAKSFLKGKHPAKDVRLIQLESIAHCEVQAGWLTQSDAGRDIKPVLEPVVGDAGPNMVGPDTSAGGVDRRATEVDWDPGLYGDEEVEDLHLFPVEEEDEAAAWMYSVSASDVGSGSA